MNNEFVVVYEAPYMWKAAVLEADGVPADAECELIPYYTDPQRNGENRKRFSKEELKALEVAKASNGSVLVRAEALDGTISYRRIIAAGKGVENFCEQNFNTDETRAKNLVIDFLSFLGASDIDVEVDHSLVESESTAYKGKSGVSGGKKGVAQASVDGSGRSHESGKREEHINSHGQVQRNDADYERAKKMLAKNAWLKINFESLCERAERGMVHGKRFDKISRSSDSDFTKNVVVALSAAAKYQLIDVKVKTEMERAVNKHKNETAVLTWSCTFPE